MNYYFCGFYRCVNSGESLKNLTLSPLDFIQFGSNLLGCTRLWNSQKQYSFYNDLQIVFTSFLSHPDNLAVLTHLLGPWGEKIPVKYLPGTLKLDLFVLCISFHVDLKRTDFNLYTLWTNSAEDKLFLFFFLIYVFRKLDLTFLVNYLSWRQFSWNDKTWFLVKKIKKIFQIVVCWKFYPACKALTYFQSRGKTTIFS